MSYTAYLNIGTNTGDRHDNLRQAVACLTREFKGARIRLSDIVESVPWGYESHNLYLNQGIAIESDGTPDPLNILHRILVVQNAMCTDPHRNADGSYRDRVIDIDLIAIDSLAVDTEELQLPHPRMHLREFVLRPMAQLDPGWRHPHSLLTPEEMLRRL
ncbi:MAG: 2-amino-4-hydroxy-6-hydroxymethyldihydropteridine diphosphokinase [Muribaculaceae bacterium]|nr:2-amino-4-hydroxy-6-hydroxymethyldihydropteridine diphosphokinase [Muribaculaceae bacterium]